MRSAIAAVSSVLTLILDFPVLTIIFLRLFIAQLKVVATDRLFCACRNRGIGC